MNYPTLVYRTPGTHHCHGGTYDYKGVSIDSELDKALAEGWFITLPEAIAGERADPVDDSAPTRGELEAKAAELDIKFDGRTTDRILAEKIDAALQAKE